MGDRLYRSVDDRVFAGVCGGIADRFDLDPSLVRVGWIVVGILTGILPMLALYVILAIVVPQEPPGLLGSLPVSPPPGNVAAEAWQAAQLGERAARRATRRADRASRGSNEAVALLFGVGLIVVGVLFLARELIGFDWDLVWPAVLVAVGGLLVVGGLRRRPG